MTTATSTWTRRITYICHHGPGDRVAITDPNSADRNYQLAIWNNKNTRQQTSTTHIEAMKKIKTPLKLTKTTIRALRDAELTEVRGGIVGGLSENPNACVGYYTRAYGDKA
jgi:hypothetical protein